MFSLTSSNPATHHTPTLSESRARCSLADFPSIAMSKSDGGVIPSKVSNRNMSRLSSCSCMRVSAAIILLPPLQTPHSTTEPFSLRWHIYLIASIIATCLSLLVMVKLATCRRIWASWSNDSWAVDSAITSGDGHFWASHLTMSKPAKRGRCRSGCILLVK